MMAALLGPRDSRDLGTGCLTESNRLWQRETNSHISQTKQNQTIITEGRPHSSHLSKKIITSVVVATVWLCGDTCTTQCTMECSNNFCPLQLYMSSTTVSLTPGQCYTEFNEGALMSGCHSWHHIVNSYVAGEKKTGSTASPCSLPLGNHGLFPKSFVSPTSNDFLIQVVIFHL